MATPSPILPASPSFDPNSAMQTAPFSAMQPAPLPPLSPSGLMIVTYRGKRYEVSIINEDVSGRQTSLALRGDQASVKKINAIVQDLFKAHEQQSAASQTLSDPTEMTEAGLHFKNYQVVSHDFIIQDHDVAQRLADNIGKPVNGLKAKRVWKNLEKLLKTNTQPIAPSSSKIDKAEKDPFSPLDPSSPKNQSIENEDELTEISADLTLNNAQNPQPLSPNSLHRSTTLTPPSSLSQHASSFESPLSSDEPTQIFPNPSTKNTPKRQSSPLISPKFISPEPLTPKNESPFTSIPSPLFSDRNSLDDLTEISADLTLNNPTRPNPSLKHPESPHYPIQFDPLIEPKASKLPTTVRRAPISSTDISLQNTGIDYNKQGWFEKIANPFIQRRILLNILKGIRPKNSSASTLYAELHAKYPRNCTRTIETTLLPLIEKACLSFKSTVPTKVRQLAEEIYDLHCLPSSRATRKQLLRKIDQFSQEDFDKNALEQFLLVQGIKISDIIETVNEQQRKQSIDHFVHTLLAWVDLN